MRDNRSIERTVFRWGWIASALIPIACLPHFGPRFVLGLFLGAALEMFSLYWLRDGAHAVVQRMVARQVPAGAPEITALGPPPRFGQARFALRVSLVALGLIAIFAARIAPLSSAVAGLIVPSAGLLAVACEAFRG